MSFHALKFHVNTILPSLSFCLLVSVCRSQALVCELLSSIGFFHLLLLLDTIVAVLTFFFFRKIAIGFSESWDLLAKMSGFSWLGWNLVALWFRPVAGFAAVWCWNWRKSACGISFGFSVTWRIWGIEQPGIVGLWSGAGVGGAIVAEFLRKLRPVF